MGASIQRHTYICSHASVNSSVNCLVYAPQKVNNGTNIIEWSFKVRKKWDRNETTESGPEEVTEHLLTIKHEWEVKKN